MKKKILITISILICFLVGCNGKYEPVNSGDISSVNVWTESGIYELSEEEAAEFISLYNNSEYKGKASGEGGTPEFGATISMNNGDEIHLNEFGGKAGDFEVFDNSNKDFYFDNEELLSFITKLCEDNIS